MPEIKELLQAIKDGQRFKAKLSKLNTLSISDYNSIVMSNYIITTTTKDNNPVLYNSLKHYYE